MKRNKKKSLRSELATCTAKICSYIEVDKLSEARQWATILQQKLIDLNLLVDIPARRCYDGAQSENKTTMLPKK